GSPFTHSLLRPKKP
ncbi:hypothetical protein D037_4024B, partial [Vibrio parahaemolyticus IDH02640]